MGCHTWAYAHIPEKATEWNHEYAETLRKSSLDMIEHVKNMSIEQLQEYADEENNQNQEWLDLYKDMEINDINYFNKAINDYFHGSRAEYEKYCESISGFETPESIKERQIQFNQKTIDEFNKYGEERVIDFIIDNQDNNEVSTGGIFEFGLFIIKDGKMYRDTMHSGDEKYREKPVFEKRFHDMFRIRDYNAKPCYSKEEMEQRCREYNVECPQIAYEFWETYPDGIIEFG